MLFVDEAKAIWVNPNPNPDASVVFTVHTDYPELYRREFWREPSPVVIIGLGPESARSIEWVVDTFRPRRVVNVGTAGSSWLPVRTVILCRAFARAEGCGPSSPKRRRGRSPPRRSSKSVPEEGSAAAAADVSRVATARQTASGRRAVEEAVASVASGFDAPALFLPARMPCQTGSGFCSAYRPTQTGYVYDEEAYHIADALARLSPPTELYVIKIVTDNAWEPGQESRARNLSDARRMIFQLIGALAPTQNAAWSTVEPRRDLHGGCAPIVRNPTAKRRRSKSRLPSSK